jgi:nucleotide-binding universal stress UspA family protein
VSDEVEAEAVIENSRNYHRRLLAELRPLATAKGVKAHFEVAVGHPAEQIIFDADRHGVDLIVVGDRGRSKFARLLLGSVSKQVVQYADRAVLVVR